MPSQIRRVCVVLAVGALAAVPAVVWAARPHPGTFAGGCKHATCTLSLKTTKHKITNLSYGSSNCGGVSDAAVSIPISKKGFFSYSPPPPPEAFVITVSLKGRFVTSTKATGTITVLNYEQGKSKPTCKQSAHFAVKKAAG